MAHYGDDDGNNTAESMSSDEDSNEENVYFDPKPRRINFDDLEYENCVANATDTKAENVPKQKKKLLGDEANKKFTCDICKKFFEKRWALNSHMLLHSGYVWYIVTTIYFSLEYKNRFVSVINRSAALIRRVQSNMLTGK